VDLSKAMFAFTLDSFGRLFDLHVL
jgi:hypothetical protein